MPNGGPRNGSGSTPGARCCPSISPGRARGLDLRNRVGHIPIEARFDLYIWLMVRDHDISCQWRTAHTPSRGLSQAFRGGVSSLPRRNRQGATRGVARRNKILKRRYTVMVAAVDLTRPPANGAINGSWRRVRARARGGV